MAKEAVIRIRAEVDGFKAELAEAGKSTDVLSADAQAAANKATEAFKKTGAALKQAFASGEVNAAVKANSQAVDQLAVKLDELFQEEVKLLKSGKQLSAEYQANRKAAAEARAEFERLKSTQTELVQTGQKATKEFKTLSGELRFLKNEISKLEQAGEEGSAQFVKLATQAARLEDQIGDTRERIRVLASDTFAFDALVDGTQTVVAGFQIAEGAAALFGVENEKLQETLVRLNALLNIQNGLQQVAAFVTGQSEAKLAVLNVAQAVNATATNLTSAAYKALGVSVATTSRSFNLLKGAIIGTGIGLLVVGVGIAIQKFIEFQESVDNSAKAAERYNAAIQGSVEALQKLEDLQRSAADRIALAQGKVTRAQLEQRDAIEEAGDTFESALAPLLATQKKLQREISKSNAIINEQRAALAQASSSRSEGAALAAASAQAALNDELEKNADLNAKAANVQEQINKLKEQFRATSVNIRKAFAEEEVANRKTEKTAKDKAKTVEQTNRNYKEQIQLLNTLNSASLNENEIELAKDQLSIEEQLVLLKRRQVAESNQFTEAGLRRQNQLIQQEAELAKISAKNADDRVTIQLNADRQIADNTAKFYEERTRIIANTFSQVVNSTFEIINNGLDKQIEAIEKEREFALENTKLTEEQRNDLIKRSDDEIRKLKIKQAQNDKAAALFNIFINTAQGVTSALANKNIPLAIAIGIAGAAQGAAVASRPLPQFKKGGFVDGQSHEAGGTVIEAERNEFVVRADRAPHHRHELEAMNRSREAYIRMIQERYVRPEIVSFASEVRRADSVKVNATLNSKSLEAEMRRTRRATVKGFDALSSKMNQYKNPRNYWK